MKKEELMQPRYKVIADYPLSQMYFNVGTILTWNGYSYIATDLPNKKRLTDISMAKETVESYPHLFKPLLWWEDRKPEDMPEYVKLVWGKDKIQYVHKVEKWTGENQSGQPLYEHFNKVKYLTTSCVVDLDPATLEEYTAYNSTPTP